MKKKNKKPFAKSYLNNKGIFNYGIPTAVICLIIYYFLRGDAISFAGIGADLMIPVFVTVFICVITLIPTVRGEMRKGKVPPMPLEKANHPIYRHFSDNLVVMSIQFAIFSTLIFAMIPGGILAVIAFYSSEKELVISPNAYWILKSLYSGVFVAFSIKWAAYCTVSQQQSQLSAEVF
jgi:hypothetical protein